MLYKIKIRTSADFLKFVRNPFISRSFAFFLEKIVVLTLVIVISSSFGILDCSFQTCCVRSNPEYGFCVCLQADMEKTYSKYF